MMQQRSWRACTAFRIATRTMVLMRLLCCCRSLCRTKWCANRDLHRHQRPLAPSMCRHKSRCVRVETPPLLKPRPHAMYTTASQLQRAVAHPTDSLPPVCVCVCVLCVCVCLCVSVSVSVCIMDSCLASLLVFATCFVA